MTEIVSDRAVLPDEADEMKALVGTKKKAKKTKSDALAALTELAGEDADGSDLMAKLSKPKRRTARGADASAAADEGGATERDERYVQYDFLLKRVYAQIQSNEKDSAKDKKHVIRFPQVQRDGGKKSAFTNFVEVCRSFNRENDRDHVLNFLYAELQTQGASDQNNCLILKGKWNSQKIELVLRKYINQYVMCPQCHDIDTRLVRDPTSRVYTLNCNTCRASRSVTSISAGYRAQVGRRKKAA